MRCQDRTFWQYLESTGRFASGLVWGADMAADCVRSICLVKSRSDLDDDMKARERWRELDAAYQAFGTDQKYAGARR